METNNSLEMARMHLQGLVFGVTNAQEMFATKVEGADPGSEEAQKCREACEAIGEFYENNFQLTDMGLRTVRTRDERSLLQGQHPGGFLTVEGDDGSTLRMNFFGGLRVLSSGDVKDGDVAMRHSHTSTTDKVLMQPVQVNWQLTTRDGRMYEAWIVVNNASNNVNLSHLSVDGERVDVLSTSTPRDNGYSDTKSLLLASTRALAQLIPHG